MGERPILAPATFATVRARRICLIKPSALGDVVQALPVAAALRRRFPDARISWVINTAYLPLIEPISVIDEPIPFDRQAFRVSSGNAIAAIRRLVGDLRGRRFDLVVDLQGLLRTGVMTLATGARWRLGLASARELANVAYTHVIDDLPKTRNAVDRYWSVARLLGLEDAPREFPLELSVGEQAAAEALLARLPRPVIGVNAGARWATKRWPADRFASAASRLLKRGGSAVVLGGPGEEPIAEAVASRIDRPKINLAGKTPLRLLAALLARLDLVLTNDTGPMHLAAAVGTPTVSVFTCTSPQRAAPFGGHHRQIQTTVPCAASYRRACNRLDCMTDVTPERVVEIARPMLPEARLTGGNGHRAA